MGSIFLSLVAAAGIGQAQDLPAQVQDALIRDSSATIALSGHAHRYGSDCVYGLIFTGEGPFLKHFGDNVMETFGFDGKTLWETDYTGAPRDLNFEDGAEERLLDLLITDQWLIKGDGYTTQADPIDHSKLRLTVSKLNASIALDALTHRPVEATFHLTDGDADVKFGGWKEIAGRVLPCQVSFTEGGATETYTVDEGSEAHVLLSYKKPAWKPDDCVWDPKAPSALEFKRAISGHFLVHPLVDGKDVGWFILDSGAEVMVIDTAAAKTLELPSIGSRPLTGIGGTVQSAIRTCKSFALGPLTLSNLHLSELDLGPIGKALGVKIGGVVGYEYFKRAIIDVDVSKPFLAVHNPATYKLPGGSWTPMLFDGGNPVVEAQASGTPVDWYLLDIGATDTVSFHAPFVAANHMLDGRETQAASSGGVGGFTKSRSGKIDWFELGGERVKNVRATFSLADQGAFSTTFLAGNIGQSLMKPFVVVFDFDGSRIGFVRKAASN